MGTDSLGNPVSTMTVSGSALSLLSYSHSHQVCTECGIAPAYWQLKDSVLTAVLFDNVEGQSTINLPLTEGKINFVTEDNSSLSNSPIYCGVVSTRTRFEGWNSCKFNPSL
jgi:hypothetical protein